MTQSTPDHAFGYVPGAVLYVWRGVITVEAVRSLAETMEVARGDSDGIPGLLLGVVEAGTPPPASDVRKAMAELLREGKGFVQASALAFEGEGFAASMVRAVATGLALLARQPFPHQVFATVSSAVESLEGSVAEGSAGTRARPILAAMDALRDAPHQ